MIYKIIDNYYFGFMDGKISELAAQYTEFFDAKYMLITCIDSSFRPGEKLRLWIDYLNSAKLQYVNYQGAILFNENYIEQIIIDNKIFFGFDEIYLFDESPSEFSVINNRYTSDGCVFDNIIPSDFVAQFMKLKALRYLSDGCGLNFVCNNLKYLKILKNYENALTEPPKS